ncbi:AF4/FMR2 family member 3 isoform X2 [Xenopus tropicalis]|uniref:AF4/FMR2 family member 3 isoform X2 n=1 Tax=Xenopus tropicalis TaxID=8364 RepID=A0A8J1J4R5_XENTR|nr:AF4/FMR2 family member 3 isoform X2 [Xenopus tropicalis]
MTWQDPGHSFAHQQQLKTSDRKMVGSATKDCIGGHQKCVMEKNKNCLLQPVLSPSSSDNPPQNILVSNKNSSHRRQHPQLNCSLEISSSAPCMQNFSATKLNAVQQKPTAYVRPMDGQEQAVDESPKLKSSTEVNILLPLYRELCHKRVSDKIKSDEIDTCSNLNQEEENHLSNIGLSSKKNADFKDRSPTKCAPQISMLEDDLKLSSDEEDIDQAVQEESLGVQSDSGEVQDLSKRTSGVSTLTSSSSSESDTSSESDSESESSSSEAECTKASGYISPEPEQPTSNKWQLDKWLNKVHPNKTVILSNTHCPSYGSLKEDAGNSENLSQICQSNHNCNKDTREDKRPWNICTDLGNNKDTGLKSSASIEIAASIAVAVPTTESTFQRQPACRKLTRRTEQTSTGDKQNCYSPDEPSLNQATVGDNITEQPKSRLLGTGRGLYKRDPRTSKLGAEIRRTRGLNRSASKSKEFIQFSSQSSDLGIETELEISALSTNTSATPATENNHRLKEWGGNNINRASPCVANTTTTTDLAKELDEQYYTLVPFGRNENVFSIKGNDEVKSLWVRIDLTLLSRIPVELAQETLIMNTSMKEAHRSSTHKSFTSVAEKALEKTRKKRKSENEASREVKKNHVEKDNCLQETVLSDTFDMANLHSTNPIRTSMSESKSHVYQRSLHVPSETSTLLHTEDVHLNLWSSLPHGHKDLRSQMLFDNRPRSADYFMQEAKQMKHKADAMMDKFDKVLNYTEAALSFIECGNAMEHGPIESKSPYTMYAETVELIRYALRLKSHSGPNATSQDKKITALCYRCLALLYWRMFRLKRDHAVKYSKALIDYFKSSSKASQASSSQGSNGKTTGTPSPTSPSPSSVSSVGSQGSTSNSSIISIPQRIHQMAANHVSITNSILHSYDYWEIADNLTKDNQEFFNELDVLMGPITLHSSMEHLVQYTRQGLHWVRHSAHML